MDLDTADDRMSSVSNAQGIAMTADNHLYSSLVIKNYQDLLFVGILETAKQKVKKYIQMAKDIGIDLIKESDSVKWSAETVDFELLRVVKLRDKY